MINPEKFLTDPWNYFLDNKELFINANPQLIFEILLDRYTTLLNLYLNNSCGVKELPINIGMMIPISPWLKKEIEILFYNCLSFYNENEKISLPQNNLSVIHNILSKNILILNSKSKDLKFINRKPHGKAKSIVQKIEREVQDSLYNLNLSYILIGSMADGKYIWEWSDYDAVIFLNDNELSPNKLEQLKNKIFKIKCLLYYIDPFQDHGFFVFSNIHKNFYSESFMPITVLENGSHLFNNELKLKIIESLYFNSVPIFRTLNKSLQSSNLVFKSYENYRLLLHRLYMAPSLILQSTNNHLYKPEAIKNINDHFKDTDLSYFSELENIYTKFSFRRYYRFILPFSLLYLFPFIIPYLLRKWYSIFSVPDMSAKKVNNIVNKMIPFLNLRKKEIEREFLNYYFKKK